MRVHGWCTECRRPRLVATSGAELAVSAARQAVPAGTCDECQHAADVRRRIVSRYGQTWVAEIHICAELRGLKVASTSHDPPRGWTVLLEDGREVEATSVAGVRAELARMPRRRVR